MNQVNPELVINDLLEQNKQQAFQLSMMRALLSQQSAAIEHLEQQLEFLREDSDGEKD